MPSGGRSIVRRPMAQSLVLLLGLLVGGGAVYAWARGRIGAERLSAEEKLTLVREAQSTWEDRVKAATGDAFSRSQTSLLELAEAKLAPIKDTLQKFETQARGLEEPRLNDVSRIGEQLRAVAEGEERLRTETGSLVTALRAPHVRGRWGEVQLKRVVELAGMLDYCDFRTQESERDSDGRLLRPAVVGNPRGGKCIVVASKVPIEASLDALNCEDVALKRAHLARHAAQVRDHIKKLGQKRYWDQFESTPE